MKAKQNKDNETTVKINKFPKISMAGVSYIGTRDYQQDTYFLMESPIGGLAVICDGMGGMENGELASRKAVELLASHFEAWKGEEPVPVFLQKEAEAMDKVVAELTGENGEPIESGTTVVCVVAIKNQLYWLSVGDSRIYILRGDEMQCVTRAHNYGFRLEMKLQNKEISQEEYNKELKQSEALISYLGMNGLEMIDINQSPFELMYGDRILLCSDGLYKCLSSEKLESILLSSNYNIRTSLDELMDAVKNDSKRNKDNTTVILMSYE